jgi:hypothetical protein
LIAPAWRVALGPAAFSKILDLDYPRPPKFGAPSAGDRRSQIL